MGVWRGVRRESMEGFSGQEILSVMLQWWIHETSVRTHGRYKTKGEPWFKLWTLGDREVSVITNLNRMLVQV